MWTAVAPKLARLLVLAVMIHVSLAQTPAGYREQVNIHYQCLNENSTSLVASASPDCHEIGCCQSLCDEDITCRWFEFATGLSFCNGGGGCCWPKSTDVCAQGLNAGALIKMTAYPGFTSYLKEPVCPQYPGYTSYAAQDRDGSDIRNVQPEGVPRLCDTNCACRGFNSAGWIKTSASPLIDRIGSCFYVKDNTSGCGVQSSPPGAPLSARPASPSIQPIPGFFDTSDQSGSTADTPSSNVALAVGLAVGLGGAALLAIITALVIVRRKRRQGAKKPADVLSSTFSPSGDIEKVLVEVVRERTISDGDTSRTPNETTSNASSTLLTSGREVEVNVRSVFLMMAEQTCNARPATSLEGVAVTPLSPLVDGLTLDVNIARDVVVNEAIGKGGHGAVHKGRFKNMDVAVKILPATDSMYIQELGILGSLRHPNIVSLLGAGVKGKQVYLIMDLADTSLDKLLYSHTSPFDVAIKPPEPTAQPLPGRMLPLPLILSIAVQVSKGLTYLHPTVIHRDLKPPNILINKPDGSASPAVKLTDFGLARMMASVVLQTGQPTVGTIAYMAPECFQNQKEGITCKADIYSFGICLWELLHGQLPWYQVDPGLILFKVVVQKTRPEFSVSQDRCPPDLRVLIEQCWDADASGRPNADDLLVQLSNMVQQSEKAA